jgi:hypothetical protein
VTAITDAEAAEIIRISTAEGDARHERYIASRQECSFCGWEDGRDWIKPRAGRPGLRGTPGTQALLLCGFCHRSFTVTAWLTNGHTYYAERDQMMAANVLRALILGREVKR